MRLVHLSIIFLASAVSAPAEDPPSQLAQAVANLDPQLVEQELARGADPDQTYLGDPLVQAVLGRSPALGLFEGPRDPEEQNALVFRVVEALLEAGADPNQIGRSGETFLTMMIYKGGTEELLALAVAHGADPDKPNGRGLTPLLLSGSSPWLEAGADPNIAHQKSGFAPLMRVAAIPDIKELAELLEAGASPAAVDARGRNAFHYLGSSHPDFPENLELWEKELLACAEQLLAAGGDPHLADTTGTTPLHLFAENSSPALLRWCLDQQTAFDAEDAEGRTPLARALESARPENARLLLMAGAEQPATGLLAPMARARHEGNLSVQDYEAAMLEMGALQGDPDLPDSQGWTALMWAAASDATGALEYLLERGADPEKAAPDGRRALHFAAGAGNGASVDLLLARAAQVDAPDAKGATPADWAIRWGHAQVAGRLLAAMPPSPDTLRLALGSGSTTAVERLLDGEPAWAVAEIGGSPPLHHAIAGRHLDLVSLLIERGADVNAEDSSELTPLAHAVALSSLDIVEMLIENGADPATPKGDKSPLHLAVVANQSILLDTLLAAMPDGLNSEISASLLTIAMKKDDLALFRFLLHHDKLHFAPPEGQIDPKNPDAFLAAARAPSDRYLRELLAKTRWKPDPDDLALNQIWLTAVSTDSVAVAKFLRDTFSIDIKRTAEERGLHLPPAQVRDDPFTATLPNLDGVPFGIDPLWISLELQNAKMAAYLRSEGATLEETQELHDLAITLAIEGHTGLLGNVLDFLSSPDVGEPSLLMLAAQAKNPDCVALLLSRGADPTRVDGDGKSVLDYAHEGDDGEAIHLLRQALP